MTTTRWARGLLVGVAAAHAVIPVVTAAEIATVVLVWTKSARAFREVEA
ncbi:hypothetical protein ACWGE0_01335 [Lentzea sp. NPDC054927]